MKSGQNKAVNGDNLSQYIDLVTHWTMIEVKFKKRIVKLNYSRSGCAQAIPGYKNWLQRSL